MYRFQIRSLSSQNLVIQFSSLEVMCVFLCSAVFLLSGSFPRTIFSGQMKVDRFCWWLSGDSRNSQISCTLNDQRIEWTCLEFGQFGQFEFLQLGGAECTVDKSPSNCHKTKVILNEHQFAFIYLERLTLGVCTEPLSQNEIRLAESVDSCSDSKAGESLVWLEISQVSGSPIF